MRLILPRLAGAFAVAAIAMPLSAGAAPDQSVPGSQQVGQAAANATQMTRVHHACTVIMGLDNPGELYDICVSNLIRSLRELEQAGLVSTDRRACRKKGLETGTPAFGDCVLDAEQPVVYRGQ